MPKTKKTGTVKISNGSARQGGSNAPHLQDIVGNCAGHICLSCGGVYVVSAYANHQFSSKDAGWRVCPHCHGTEATIWYEKTLKNSKWDWQKVYHTTQRLLTEAERAIVLGSKPTARGHYRLDHTKRAGRANRFA